MVSQTFGLGIEYKLRLLQAEIGVGVSSVGSSIVPSRCGVREPFRLMG